MRLFVNIALPLFLLCYGAVGQTPPAPSSQHDRAIALIDEGLTNKNPDTRKHAVQALGLAAVREPYLTQCEAMLDDKDVEVRLATVTSLVDLKNKRTLAALQKALNDDVPEVSFAAAKALWSLHEPAGRDALVAVLSGETKTSSSFLTKQKREALRMFQTPRTLFTFALMQGIGMAPIPGVGQGVSSLQGILSDPGVSGRAASALLLSSDQTPEVLQALRDGLTDKDWSVRAASVHAVALRDTPALAGDIAPLFDDKNEAVRLRAAAGWLRLDALKAALPKPAAKKATTAAPAKKSTAKP
jgi:HEAT repeat protein